MKPKDLNERINDLIKRIFREGDGRELLELLLKQSNDTALFSKDPIQMGYNVAQRDFIVFLHTIGTTDVEEKSDILNDFDI